MRHWPFALLLAAAAPALAGIAPSQMMANVFRLSEAGAVLQICFESEAHKALPEADSHKLRELSQRIGALVKSIGARYKDETLGPTYEATRARIAGESRLRLHVKNHYGYCGERLASEMEKYVAENEALLGPWLRQAPSGAIQRRAPDPPPVRR